MMKHRYVQDPQTGLLIPREEARRTGLCSIISTLQLGQFGLTQPQGGASDPFWANVWYQTDFEDGTSATEVVDQSVNAATRVNGAASSYGQRSTTQVRWGTYSWSSVGTSTAGLSARYATSNADNAFGQTFTAEFWVYPLGAPASWVLMCGHAGSLTGSGRWNIGTVPTVGQYDKPAIWVNGNNVANSATAFTHNAWNYVALSVDAGEASLYLNGTRVATYSGINDAASSPIQFAGGTGGSANWDAYWDAFRFTKNVARYSGTTCPVPTSAWPVG